MYPSEAARLLLRPSLNDAIRRTVFGPNALPLSGPPLAQTYQLPTTTASSS